VDFLIIQLRARSSISTTSGAFLPSCSKRLHYFLVSSCAGLTLFPRQLSTHGSKYGCGAITEEFVRSDGAGSHFKNKYTMYYLTKYKVQFGLGRSTWCIGCPSHGKGPWWVPSRDFSDIISTYFTPHPLNIYVGMDWLAR
jgi:hypothetical protein